MNKIDAMEETSSIQLPISLLTNCTLTICDKISSDGKLCAFITDTLKFKIINMFPLVIEKDDPSPDDINNLLHALNDSLQSHNRKDDKLIEHHSDSLELKQREGNATCESLVQTSSLGEPHETKQFAEYKLKNQYGDSSTYEVSSQQAQGINDDVLDLANDFQSLGMNDVSDDNDYVQGHNPFENTVSGNAISRELTNALLELDSENIALSDNVTDAEKQENNSQDRGEDKKQVEAPQPEYLRKQDSIAEHSSADMQIMQNSQAAKELEMKHSSMHEEQLSADIQEIDVTHTKLIAGQENNSNQAVKTSREINKQLQKNNEEYENISAEKSYRITTDHIQCHEHAEPRSEKITESFITSSQQGLSKQDNVAQCSSFECGRQRKIDIEVHSQDVETQKKNYDILGTNTKADMSHAKYANETQSVVSEDANTSKEMQMLVDDKKKNYNMTSSDFACRVETREDYVQYQNDFSASEILSMSHDIQDNADSSDSDAESKNVTIYSMKVTLIDGIKMYFKEPHYGKYFNDAKSEGNNVIFSLNTCNDEDVSFLNTLKQLKVEECEFDHKDKQLESALKDIQTQTGQLIIQIKDNKVHIVGLKDSVTSAKKRVQLLLQNYDKKNSQHLDMVTVDKSTAARTESLEKYNLDTRNHETSRKKMSDYEKPHEQRRPQISEFNDVHRRVPESHTSVNDLLCHASSRSEDSYPKHKAGKTTYSGNDEHYNFSKGENIYYTGNKRSQVTILKADITKLQVDCIVNAANKRLQHGGGVAKAISSAAGPALKKECEDFIQSGNQVAVADIFVSTGGNMPAKCVIHAVGPKWESYDDNSKSQCLQDLRHTVIRCLVEADRRGFTSIAFPSISAAIFKVPKNACARCYMEAVKHFDILNEEQTSLRDIRFVDVDETMVKIIQEHFQRNWTNPCNSDIFQEDVEFVKASVLSAARNAAKRTELSPGISKLTSSSSSVSTKTPGASKSSTVVGDKSRSGNTVASSSDLRTERSSIYQIGKFTLHTDTRPAFDHSADVTITVGKPFDKLSGLHDFSVSSNKKEKQSLKNKFKLFSLSKPKGQQEKLVCALLPEPDDADTIKKAIENLSTIIHSPDYNIFKKTIGKVVLTSSILYNEPYNTQKKGKKHSYERKKVGDFARCLFDYLDHVSGITASRISVTVVGSEDALQSIHTVLESRGVKKISPEVLGASSMARKSFSHHSQSNSGQYPGHAVQVTSYTKQHGEEAHQGARSNAREPSPYRHYGNSGQNPGSAAEGTAYTKQHAEEAHQGARSMARDPSPHCHYGNSGQHPGYEAQGTDYPKQHHEEDVGSSVDSEKVCGICAWPRPLYPARCCGNYLCLTCQQKMSVCPYCRTFWRVLTGDQPMGGMAVSIINDHADGYENTQAWEIQYVFPSGVQKDHHPNPGKMYAGMNRTAYLPVNELGWYVLKLLRLAFLRKLTFTVGRSLTMNRENSIIWNDIHHKTNLHGGPHGYPDPNYLLNVIQELASKGVTFDTMSKDERFDLDYFEFRLAQFRHFIDIFSK